MPFCFFHVGPKCWFSNCLPFSFANSFAPYRGQNPQKREKRVGVEKPPFPTTPEKGVPSQKNPHFPCSALYRNGYFWLGTPFSGVVGNGVFRLRNPLFPFLNLSKRGRFLSKAEILGWGSFPPFQWYCNNFFTAYNVLRCKIAVP